MDFVVFVFLCCCHGFFNDKKAKKLTYARKFLEDSWKILRKSLETSQKVSESEKPKLSEIP